ncbi:MAG TPA: ABC transporter substrate-binding protein [Burkholderiales bacterium]|jgi:putative ABC transport system substrate-binding protein|nr:ABC transporter substrate-binding protein [Burkholderiales bacterium]
MKITRREFLVRISAAAAATPLAALGQQPQKSLRLGILSSGTIEMRGHLEQALLRSLNEQGYIEGRNLTIERRYAGAGGRARVIESAQELAALNLDAVVTTCSPSTGIAKNAMSSTPIVMAAVSDPVGQGLIASLARPGGNITGLSSQGEELLPKMMEFFSKVLPRSATIAVLGNANNPVHARMWQKLHDAAAVRALNLSLIRVEFSSSANLPAAFDAIVRDHAGALFALGDDPLVFNQQVGIVRLAAKHRLPDFYWAREFVDAGGLMSYGENLRTDYRSAAAYVVRVGRGAKPADLPVQQPTKFELVINRKTAKTLGITLPQDLLLLADEVIS